VAHMFPPGPPSLPAFNFISPSPPASEGLPDSPILSNRASIMSVPRSPVSAYVFNGDRTYGVTRSDSTATSSAGHFTSSGTTVSSLTSYESAPSTVQVHSKRLPKHGRSHSRDLDPNLPRLPPSPYLPAKFGMSEEEKRGSFDQRALLRSLTLNLKVANK